MQKVKTLILTLLFLLPLSLFAQGRRFVHYNCMERMGEQVAKVPAGPRKSLPDLYNEWDSTRVYNVPVLLMEFSDKSFSMDDPLDHYQRIFNEEGYNLGVGPGCVADYFREQSNGLFRPHFDIFGPVKINKGSKECGKFGGDSMSDAIMQLADSINLDFSLYDWNESGIANSFIVIYAGYGGNEDTAVAKNSIWPNTGYTTGTCREHVLQLSASNEMWASNNLAGIGTICHEFCHTLGLPDVYPTSGSEFSVWDEWELMDGGNYINNGWCPPTMTAHMKIMLGWLQPEVLDAPATITDLKPVAEGGKVYKIPTEDENEYYLLENRQWKGWDLRIPGHGLLISHVDYSPTEWRYNSVNTRPNHHRYDLVHADNMDYTTWEDLVGKGAHLGGHSRLLSGSAYPYVTDSITNNALTDTSEPAAITYSGTGLLSKPITGIRETEGAITFQFMGGVIPDGIVELKHEEDKSNASYDLTGRRVGRGYRGLVIRNHKKIVIH